MVKIDNITINNASLNSTPFYFPFEMSDNLFCNNYVTCLRV